MQVSCLMAWAFFKLDNLDMWVSNTIDRRIEMLDVLYAVWDLDCDDPGIIGLFETKDEADAHAAYVTHKYCRAMTVVEYLAKENES